MPEDSVCTVPTQKKPPVGCDRRLLLLIDDISVWEQSCSLYFFYGLSAEISLGLKRGLAA
jgi:hypothetical protein